MTTYIENFEYPKKNTWSIYTKSNCKYCTMVKELLLNKNNNDSIVIIDSDKWIENNDIKNIFLLKIKNIIGYEYKYFPMVFYDEKFIGGFTETLEYLCKNQKYNDIKLEITEDF